MIVRPTHLVEGEELGEGEGGLRVGSEEKPAVGWTVSRKDVGGWTYRELVERGVEGFGKWEGEKVTLTY